MNIISTKKGKHVIQAVQEFRDQADFSSHQLFVPIEQFLCLLALFLFLVILQAVVTLLYLQSISPPKLNQRKQFKLAVLCVRIDSFTLQVKANHFLQFIEKFDADSLFLFPRLPEHCVVAVKIVYRNPSNLLPVTFCSD